MSWKNPAARIAEASAREQSSASAAVAASSATRLECPVRNAQLEVDELAEGLGDHLDPRRRDRRDRLRLGVEDACEGIGNVRRAQERLGVGEGRIDGPGIVAAAAAPAERLERGGGTSRLGELDEVVGDGHDPQRPRDLLPRHVCWHALSVPARRHLAERAGDLVAQMQAPGEQPPTLAQVRCRQLKLLPAPDQLLGDQPGALGQRPVVRQAADEVGHHLGRLRGRAEDLPTTMEVNLVPADPACEVGCSRSAT